MNARSEHKTWGEALVGRALELRLCALGSGLWALGSGLWALGSGLYALGLDLTYLYSRSRGEIKKKPGSKNNDYFRITSTPHSIPLRSVMRSQSISKPFLGLESSVQTLTLRSMADEI